MSFNYGMFNCACEWNDQILKYILVLSCEVAYCSGNSSYKYSVGFILQC